MPIGIRRIIIVQDHSKITNNFNCTVCNENLSHKAVIYIGEARLIECEVCGSLIYFPRPKKESVKSFYNSQSYFEHPYFKLRRNYPGGIYRRCKDIFELIERYRGNISWENVPILDIGCDKGDFLLSAYQQYGILPFGIDLAYKAVEQARENGIDTYNTDIENAPPHLKDFAFITGIDLIEHLIDPKSFFKEVYKRLRPNGYLYLETPNIKSSVYRAGQFLCNVTGARPLSIFERLYPPEHLCYFTEQGLRILAKESGLEVLIFNSRSMPTSDIAVTISIKAVLSCLQCFDYFTDERSLLCALFRRPV